MVASSFSHMLNLANLAEEVQIAHRRRIKLKKKGDFVDEASATTESDLEETIRRLVVQLKKSPAEVFDALKNQTVDLVLTAHPTQSVRRSLLQKHGRFKNYSQKILDGPAIFYFYEHVIVFPVYYLIKNQMLTSWHSSLVMTCKHKLSFY